MRGAETEPDACAESARSWLRRLPKRVPRNRQDNSSFPAPRLLAIFAFFVRVPTRPRSTPRRARSDGRGREGGVSGRWGGCRDRTSPGTRNVASGVRRARDGGPDRRVDGERGSASVGASVLDLERNRHVRVRRRVSFPPPRPSVARPAKQFDRPAARVRHAQSPAAARRGPLPFPARRNSREQRIVSPRRGRVSVRGSLGAEFHHRRAVRRPPRRRVREPLPQLGGHHAQAQAGPEPALDARRGGGGAGGFFAPRRGGRSREPTPRRTTPTPTPTPTRRRRSL